ICRSRPSTIPAGDLPPTPPVPAPPLPPRRPPSARPRKLGPAPATRRLQANDVPPKAPYDGPAVLGRPGQSVERLAAGAGHRLARHRPALAAATLPRLLDPDLLPPDRRAPPPPRREA